MNNELMLVDPAVAPAEITHGKDGSPVFIIDKKEIPASLSASSRWADQVELTIVQSAHLTENPELAKDLGKLRIKEMEIVTHELKLLPIGVIRNKRQLMPPFDSEISKPLCSSDDGLVPSKYIASPRSETCGTLVTKNGIQSFVPTCSLAAWADGTPPACSEVVVAAFLELSMMYPIILQFKRTTMASYTQLRKLYRKELELKRFTKQKIDDCVLTVTAKKHGKSYIFEFKLVEAPEYKPASLGPVVRYYQEKMAYNPIDAEAEAAAAQNGGRLISDVDMEGVDDEEDSSLSV